MPAGLIDILHKGGASTRAWEPASSMVVFSSASTAQLHLDRFPILKDVAEICLKPSNKSTRP